MSRHRIKDLPEQERPRERLEEHGADVLSNSELLAIILRTGTSTSTALELAGLLLAEFGSLEKVAGACVAELSRVKGIGPAKACQVVAAFELGRRSSGRHGRRRVRISSPEDIVSLVQAELDGLLQEKFIVVLLNSKNEVLRFVNVTQGTLTTSLVHPRETFRAAVTEGCNSVVLVHNHPSGDPEPSAEDKKVTRKLVAAGKLLGIRVLDHIIVADGKFCSLKDMGFC